MGNMGINTARENITNINNTNLRNTTTMEKDVCLMITGCQTFLIVPYIYLERVDIEGINYCFSIFPYNLLLIYMKLVYLFTFVHIVYI